MPPHRLDQSFARREMARLCEGQRHLERLIPVFDRTGVDTRRLVHEPEWYLESRSFEERNEEYAARALELAQKAVRACLARAGATPLANLYRPQAEQARRQERVADLGHLHPHRMRSGGDLLLALGTYRPHSFVMEA